MNEFCFRLPWGWKLNSCQLGLIHVIGIDGIPTPCKTRINRHEDDPASESYLHIVRHDSDSGCVFVAYPHPRWGELILSTGTLPPSTEIYDLLKELARGTLNRLRNQASIWQEGGLEIPDQLLQRFDQATQLLAGSIMSDNQSEQDRLAAETIDVGVDLIFEVADQFVDQITSFRLSQKGFSKFWRACRIAGREAGGNNALSSGLTSSPSSSFTDSLSTEFDFLQFSQVCGDAPQQPMIPESYRSIFVGPILDASSGGMDHGLTSANDYPSRREILLARTRYCVDNFSERASLFHLVAGLNGIGHRYLNYSQQLQLTTDMLQVVDDSLSETPVMVSFDFPWGERLAGAVGGIHPLQIADSLIRRAGTISFFGLEINLDFWPGGSALRDPFQWIDLIDIWAQLETPLVIILRVPTGGEPIPADAPVDRMINQQRSSNTDLQRLNFLKKVLPMLIGRPIVEGIIFAQANDSDDPRFPHGGLFDQQGKRKAIYEVINELGTILQPPRL